MDKHTHRHAQTNSTHKHAYKLEHTITHSHTYIRLLHTQLYVSKLTHAHTNNLLTEMSYKPAKTWTINIK